jgi:hypothetical protein
LAVKGVEFVTHRMLCAVYCKELVGVILFWMCIPKLRKKWWLRDSYYKELEQVLDQFLKYHLKILLGDLNKKLQRKDIFKPTFGKESLPENIMALQS